MASEHRVTRDLLFFVLSFFFPFFLVFCLFFLFVCFFFSLVFESVYSPYVHENEDISAFGIQIVFVKKFCVKNRNVFFFSYNTLVMIPQQFIYEIYELRQLVEK